MSDQKLLASSELAEHHHKTLSKHNLHHLPANQLQELAAFHIFNLCEGLETQPPFEGRRECIDAICLHIKSLSFVRWISFGLVILTFFECPHWALKQRIPLDQFPGETSKYPSWPMPFLEFYNGLHLETFLYAILFADVSLLYYAQRRNFLRDGNMRFRCILLLLYGIDIVVAFSTPANFYRIAGYCRLALYMTFNIGVRDKVILCAKSFVASCSLLLFSLVWVFFASWVALIIFPHTNAEFKVSLHNFHDTLWQMYILITTANYPDIMMAGYDEQRSEVWFFIIFLIGGIWFLGSTITGIVFSTYENEMNNKEELKTKLKKKEGKLAMACLDVDLDGEISLDDMKPALDNLCRYITIPSFDHLLSKLDRDGDGCISLEEFEAISDVLESIAERKHKNASGLLESRFGQTKWLKKSQAFIGSFWHKMIIIVMLASGGYFTATRTWSTTSLTQGNFEVLDVETWHLLADFPFSVFFFVEAVLKILVLGWAKYWSSLRRQVEFLTSLAMMIGQIYAIMEPFLMPWFSDLIPESVTGEFGNHMVARWFIALQVVRCGRLCFYVPQYSMFLRSVQRVLPATGDVLRVLFIAMFVYSLLGVQLFGGKIQINSDGTLKNPKVADAWSGADGYYANNFNDLVSGMVTLFEILIGNNWFEIAEGFSAAVDNDAARIYFVLWIIIGAQVFLNIVLAIIIGGFSDRYAEMEQKRKARLKNAMVQLSNAAATEQPAGAEDTSHSIQKIHSRRYSQLKHQASHIFDDIKGFIDASDDEEERE